MAIALLGNRFYIGYEDYGLVIEYLEDGIEFAISGNSRAGRERIRGSDLLRFVGACFSAGYSVDGFEKEVIGKLYVDVDRIRVVVEGSLNDRVFVKLKPNHFLEIAYLSLARYYPREGVLSVMDYSVRYRLSSSGVLLVLSNGQKSASIFVEKDRVPLLLGAIETSFIGRMVSSGVIFSEKEGKRLYVDEYIEPKEDPNRVIVDYLVLKNSQQKVEKPLYEWIVYLKDLAKELSKSHSGVLRSFLKRHSIAYDRKFLLSMNLSKTERLQVRLPIHFAKGLALVLQRWLYDGSF